MYLNIDSPMQGILFKNAKTGKLVYKDTNDLTYDEKREVYKKLFSYGFFDKSIDPKLILISLIASVVIATRKKTPGADTLGVIKKLIDFGTDEATFNTSSDTDFLETLAIMTDEFLYGADTGNTFGLKTIPEIKAKVKELISNRFPF